VWGWVGGRVSGRGYHMLAIECARTLFLDCMPYSHHLFTSCRKFIRVRGRRQRMGAPTWPTKQARFSQAVRRGQELPTLNVHVHLGTSVRRPTDSGGASPGIGRKERKFTTIEVAPPSRTGTPLTPWWSTQTPRVAQDCLRQLWTNWSSPGVHNGWLKKGLLKSGRRPIRRFVAHSHLKRVLCLRIESCFVSTHTHTHTHTHQHTRPYAAHEVFSFSLIVIPRHTMPRSCDTTERQRCAPKERTRSRPQPNCRTSLPNATLLNAQPSQASLS
jgi:hypothetical protein